MQNLHPLRHLVSISSLDPRMLPPLEFFGGALERRRSTQDTFYCVWRVHTLAVVVDIVDFIILQGVGLWGGRGVWKLLDWA